MKRYLFIPVMACLCVFFAASGLTAQEITITGIVKNKVSGEIVPGASVKLKRTTYGVSADDAGKFNIRLSSLPATIIVSSTNYADAEIEINMAVANLEVGLEPEVRQIEELVYAPNRVPTTLIKSPVSIEHYNYKEMARSPLDPYSIAGTKKGVDMTTSSLTFKTPSTRGFNGSGSTRVNQLVDGMDNQAPGLNFFVGNFAGLTDLDMESVEILPGASSALYGPGGMNGTILIKSKNPFEYPGFSFQAKQGVTNIDRTQRDKATPYYDYSFRWAQSFKDKFAFKVSAQYLKATDWLASDSSNYTGAGPGGKVIPGTRQTDPNYNGVNVYGDETSFDIRDMTSDHLDVLNLVAQGIKQQYPQYATAIDAVMALSPGQINISRTGYAERDIVDPETKNLKLSGALHYKLNNKLEAALMGYWATGNTVYTGNNRYILKDIKIGQYKLELKHKNWFIREYTTQEDAGEAYTATVAAQYFNEAWKSSAQWYPEYAQGFLIAGATAWGQAFGTAKASGKSDAEAYAVANAAVSSSLSLLHGAGRAIADDGRPAPGSETFRQIFNQVRKTPISEQGGRFLEKSQLWMTEGQYDFSDAVKWAQVVVGASWKRYILDSKGTLFIDTISPIHINEYGVYAEVTKRFLDEMLTLSFSGRYDKNEDFKGHFTPRATALIRLAKNNNLRLSYQTAYRFPSTQQKYIRLNVGDYILLGGLPWVTDYMQTAKYPVYELDPNGNPSGDPYVYKEFKPESCRSFEIGYKGLIAERLLADAYAYFGQYRDFLGRNALFQPSSMTVYSTVVNSSTKVKTHGYGLGLDYKMKNNYSVFVNAYSDVITDVPSGFQSYFNTPKNRVNAGIANSGFGKNHRFGFNIIGRWQDAFMWDGELANGPIKAFATLDVMVSYKFPRIKSMIKLGGTNITNHYYKNAYANPEIGGLYYVSFAYNIF